MGMLYFVCQVYLNYKLLGIETVPYSVRVCVHTHICACVSAHTAASTLRPGFQTKSIGPPSCKRDPGNDSFFSLLDIKVSFDHGKSFLREKLQQHSSASALKVCKAYIIPHFPLSGCVSVSKLWLLLMFLCVTYWQKIFESIDCSGDKVTQQLGFFVWFNLAVEQARYHFQS